MRPQDLVIRCLTERRGDQWQAICIDFDLAAQGDSLLEVRQKLEHMIGDYVRDALVGDDRKFASHFLTRRVPLSVLARYWTAVASSYLPQRGSRRPYALTMPLEPVGCA